MPEHEVTGFCDNLSQHGHYQEVETRDWGKTAFTVCDVDGYNLMFACLPNSQRILQTLRDEARG